MNDSSPADMPELASNKNEKREVQLLVRSTCGSCARIREQITPIVEEAGAQLTVVQLDGPNGDAELEQEFGDRVPVVLIDDEEFACWEVDNDELAEELARAR